MRGLDRRTFVGAAGAGLVLAAKGALAQTARVSPPADPYLAFVHPELRPAAAALLADSGRWALSTTTLAERRAGLARFSQPMPPGLRVEQRTIPGGRGQPDVGIVVVNARPGARRPAILHTHGGGYVLGDAASSVSRIADVVQALDCVLVSVNYRLAPETTYAGSIEDNYAGLKWLHAHAEELGADPARVAVMGESAGGGHAALLAITARDRGEVPLAFQCLVYPMLDDRTGTSRSAPPHLGRIIWTPEANRFGWQSFLGTAPGGATAPKDAVPARVSDLKGLPPAWIGVGGIDLFVEEDIAYAGRLIDAGVPAELLVIPGCFHGFDGLSADTSVAKRFMAAKIAGLKAALAA